MDTKSIFHTLKHAVYMHSVGTKEVENTKIGDEETLHVVDEFVASVPGHISSSSKSDKVQVELLPGSIVDNRPETMDRILFNYNGERYSVAEQRTIASQYSSAGGIQLGGLQQTGYVLYSNSSSEPINFLP